MYNVLKENADELKNIARMVYQHDSLNADEIQAAVEGRFNDIKRVLVRDEFKETEEKSPTENLTKI